MMRLSSRLSTVGAAGAVTGAFVRFAVSWLIVTRYVRAYETENVQ